jgi:hypothetical protein
MYHDQLGLHTGAIAIGSPNATTCNPQIGAIHLLPTPLAAQSFLAARIAVTLDVSRRIPLTLWASGEEPRSLARMRDYVISFLAARIASSVTRFCICSCRVRLVGVHLWKPSQSRQRCRNIGWRAFLFSVVCTFQCAEQRKGLKA